MSETEPQLSKGASAQTQFAWLRTLMGAQRTYMAATRTAVVLIGFGFTVAEVFKFLQARAPDQLRYFGPDAPHDFGLALIAAGCASLVLFTVQYRRAVAYLGSPPFKAIAPKVGKTLSLPAYLTSCTVLAIGVAGFAAVLVRL